MSFLFTSSLNLIYYLYELKILAEAALQSPSRDLLYPLRATNSESGKEDGKSLYGDNYMESFPSLELYQAEIDKLIKNGEKVQ